jgi:hypothetical protein
VSRATGAVVGRWVHQTWSYLRDVVVVCFPHGTDPASKVGVYSHSHLLEPPPVGRPATLGSEPVRRHLQGSHVARAVLLFGNPGCDGAYPQPQWDCACFTYHSHHPNLIRQIADNGSVICESSFIVLQSQWICASLVSIRNLTQRLHMHPVIVSVVETQSEGNQYPMILYVTD